MPKLEGVLKGIKVQQARKNGTTTHKRLPITRTILQKMFDFLQPQLQEFDSVMLWAAASTCFFGFMRAGELSIPSAEAFDPTTHLCFGDLSIDDIYNLTVMKLRLKASKTDPFRQGVEIIVGRTYNSLCPITAVLAYVAMRGNNPGILFHFQDGYPLTKYRFVQRVRHILSGCGLDPSKYAGHSFRIGAATSAAAYGLEDSTIKMLGRWESSTYQVYIRTSRDSLAKFSAVIGGDPRPHDQAIESISNP